MTTDTTLAQDLRLSQTSVTLAAGLIVPDAMLAVGSEYLQVTQVLTPTQGIVQRGVNGSVSSAHTAGDAVTVGVQGDFLTGPQAIPIFGTDADVLTAQGPTLAANYEAPSGGGGISGSIASGQVAVGSGTDTIAGSAALTYAAGTGIAQTAIAGLTIAAADDSGGDGITAAIIGKGSTVADVRANVNELGSFVILSLYDVTGSFDLLNGYAGADNAGLSSAFSLSYDNTTNYNGIFRLFDNTAGMSTLDVYFSAGSGVDSYLRRSKFAIGTDTPVETLTVVGTGSFSSTIKAGGYLSSDGSAGVTVTTCTGYKNGLCVSGT